MNGETEQSGAGALGEDEELFELLELPSARAAWCIERFVVSLLREGHVTIRAPSNRRLNVDGALRCVAKWKKINISNRMLPSILEVLVIAHQLCKSNSTCTLREIFYRNKNLFRNESYCQRVITAACFAVGLTRSSMGFVATGKGMVAFTPDLVGPIPPFSTFDHLESLIPYEALLERRPQFVLVLEKFTVFHRFINSDFFHLVPCIAVTGKGFPDVTTRRFVRFLRERLELACFGMADFNPFGLSIMGTYAYGSQSLSGEAFRYVVPDFVALGITSADVATLIGISSPEDMERHLQLFTQSDISALAGLRNTALVLGNRFLIDEVSNMEQMQVKLELDAVDAIAPDYLFGVWLPQKIMAAADSLGNHG